MSSGDSTVLVTGGAGFIGSHFVERLLRSGCRVVNLDLLTYAGNPANLAAVAGHERYRFVHGDIGDRHLVECVLADHRPATIVNIAAETHVDRSIDDASVFIDTNITGVFRLLESALGYWRGLEAGAKEAFRFVQMSTDEVYGSIPAGAFTEQSNYAPNSPYAASKAAGDHMTRAYGVTFGLPVVIVHGSNTYGPRQFPEKLIPHLIIAALTGQPLPVYGQGLNTRDWLFIDDLTAGLECVVARGRPGEVYNFSGSDEWKNIDAVRQLCRHLDRLAPGARPYELTVQFVADRPGHDLRYAMAIDKVRQEFGWTPRTRFFDGLERTIAWYLENRTWWQAVLRRGYHRGRIGLGGQGAVS